MIRSMDTHQYQPAPYGQMGYQGAVRTEMINNIPVTWAVTRPTSAPATPYPAQLPMTRGKGFTFVPPRQDLMMDPSNPTTWQRPYRFS